MDETADDALRRNLDAAVQTTAVADWDEVQRRARALGAGRRQARRRLALPAGRRLAAVLLGSVVLLVPSAIALGQLVLGSSAVMVDPVGLPALPAGWEVVSASPDHLRPSGTHVETLITSWRYRPYEFGPASVIPPGGTMISVALSRAQGYHVRRVNLCETTATVAGYPRRTPPLALPRTTADTLEGAPHVEEFRVFGRYRSSYDFEVRVDIDTRRPVGPRWAVAASIVRRLRFPAWPANRAC